MSTLASTRVSDGNSMGRIVLIAVAMGLFLGAIAIPEFAKSAPSVRVAAAAIFLATGLSVLSAIDLVRMRLPDVLTLPLLAGGLVFVSAAGSDTLAWHFASAILGAASIYLFAWSYLRFRGLDGIGLGDAKLFAVAGAWVGAEGLASVLLLACATGLLFAILMRLRGQEIGGQSRIPFGPFLSVGLWVIWLYGPLS